MLPASLVEAVRQLRGLSEFADLGIVCLTRSPEKVARLETGGVPVEVLPSDLTDKQEMRAVLRPFAADIRGVVCRGDKNIQYLRRLLPLLPKDVPLPTDEALQASTHKHLMRQKFAAHAPEITPAFVRVSAPGSRSIARIERAMSYPVIVKPTSLASSLLVQSCHSRAELAVTLQKTFSQIQKVYQAEGRAERPHVIVEAYLEGELYSIDAYAAATGEIWCCPPLRYIPAKQLGIDDFFIFKRYLPAGLSRAETVQANAAAEKAIRAVGLTASSAHVELIRTKDGWKVIELGPRLGRFRHQMYSVTYGIDHSLNDIKIRLGLPPIIPTRRQAFCAGYCIYPFAEGRLREIRGLRHLETMPEVIGINVFAKPGDPCKFAKNGGHALAEFLVRAQTAGQFKALTERIESVIRVIVDQKELK